MVNLRSPFTIIDFRHVYEVMDNFVFNENRVFTCNGPFLRLIHCTPHTCAYQVFIRLNFGIFIVCDENSLDTFLVLFQIKSIETVISLAYYTHTDVMTN